MDHLKKMPSIFEKIFPGPHCDRLKKFMHGQIYPAFLGACIYFAYESIFFPFTIIVEFTSKLILGLPQTLICDFDGICKAFDVFSNNTFAGNNIALKCTLLFIVLGYYFSDYYYIQFTKIYRWWFFVFDLVFVFTFLATIKFIKIEKDIINESPDFTGIFTCYVIFLFFYLIWDFFEFLSTNKISTSALPIQEKESASKEKSFYTRVILWELSSIAILVIYLNNWLPSLFWVWPLLLSLAFLLWDYIKPNHNDPVIKKNLIRLDKSPIIILGMILISEFIFSLSKSQKTNFSNLYWNALIPITLIFCRLTYEKHFFDDQKKTTCPVKDL